MMDNQLSQLNDIEGLDAISWWPLALGWWIVIAIIATLTIAVIIWRLRKLAFARSWRNDVLSQLSDMQNKLTESNSQEIITKLSELIRRIAIQKYGRSECAGIEGKAWLIWLKENDTENFDWEANGDVLIQAPYAPKGKNFPTGNIPDLINAIKKWVK